MIKLLLDADEHKQSVSKKTAVGRSALHLAINKRLNHDIIVLLLEDDDVGVPEWYKGMLPLHSAIMNQYGKETVQLLINKDEKNLAIESKLHYRRHAESESSTRLRPYMSLSGSNLDENETLLSDLGAKCYNTLACYPDDEEEDKPNDPDPQRYLSENNRHLHGIRTVQLCLLAKSKDNIRMLLQKEIEMDAPIDDMQKTAIAAGMKKRTSLHLACMNNYEVDIVELLLELDPKRQAVVLKDDEGSTPLHLACGHKNARCDVIRMLLYAERLHAKNGHQGSSRLAGELNLQHQNPLSLAAKAGAPGDVLEILMKPCHFNVRGFTEASINILAGRIKDNAALQKLLNRTLSQRKPFMLLSYLLLVNLLAVIAFFLRTESLLVTTMLENRVSTIEQWADPVLTICVISFLMREVLQLVSEKANYFFDLQNVLEFSNIYFLIASMDLFRNDNKPENTRWILQVTAFLLILSIISYLRSTFLPFSRFAGGLKVIFITLVPFFIVTTLLLLMFSYAYRVHYLLIDGVTNGDLNIKGTCDETDIEFGSVECQCVEKAFMSCFMLTLHGFFGGGSEQTKVILDVIFGVVVGVVVSTKY